MANTHNSTTHSREHIINTLYDEFQGAVTISKIEKALIRLGFISAVSKEWLKEHFIDKQLSAKECAELVDCSVGHIQGCIKKYKLTKKKFGITTGNNQAHRRAVWKRNIAKSQPHQKAVKVYHVGDSEPIFIFNSITKTAKKLQIPREHIRDCLNPKKQRKSAYGFRFEFITTVPKGTMSDNIETIVKNFHLAEQRDKELKRVRYD